MEGIGSCVKIDFELIDMKYQTITEVKECSLMLYDNRIEECLHFFAEVPVNPDDELLGKEELEHYENHVALRGHVGSVKMILTINDQWMIHIPVSGSSEDFYLFFRKDDFGKAIVAYRDIREYVLGKI
jgi:hypothetical protein